MTMKRISTIHGPLSHRATRGFTLVEALIALLCLSIGLLGIAGLQLTGLRSNLSSSFRSQATYLSYDILDRMRANRNDRFLYNAGLGAAPAPGGVATLDLAEWKASLAATLPAGDGTVVVQGVNALGAVDNTEVIVTVQWDDSRGADPMPLVFTMESRL
jgi:type IV pilus assembly protein PilV